MSEIENFPYWQSLPGMTLDGGYELKEIVEAERTRATIRVRVLGDYMLKAFASFYVLEADAAKKQVELWDAVRGIERRSDLSAPLGAGVLWLNGAAIGYVVLQSPDESLAEAVKARALSGEEATEVVRSSARALQALHAEGLVHGCVSPEEIQAVSESVKLSTESIREVNTEPIVERKAAKYLAPETEARNLTIAADIWCLGATLFEMLTQKTYEPGLYEEASELRHPFGTVAGTCLESDPDKRCKVAEIDGILKSKAPPPKLKPAVPIVSAPEAAKAAATPEEALSVTTAAPVTVSVKPEEHKPETLVSKAAGAKSPNELGSGRKLPNEPISDRKLPNELSSLGASKFRNEANESTEVRRRGWIYALSAFLLIFLILWLVRSRSTKKGVTPPAQSTEGNTSSGATSQPKPAWPTQTLSPESKTPAAAPPTAGAMATTGPGPGGTQGKTVWRVVLYTYNRQEDAERRVQDLSKKRPDLQVQMFSAKGNSGPYLVVAGGRMSRGEAVSLRERALREGMPRDSYIQNYDR
jgi:eukaryotic-like serine/threonine-protein kinase